MTGQQKLLRLNARLETLHAERPAMFVFIGAAIGTVVGLLLCPVIDWLARVGIGQ